MSKFSWKNLPYWFKGAVIVVVLYGLLNLFLWIMPMMPFMKASFDNYYSNFRDPYNPGHYTDWKVEGLRNLSWLLQGITLPAAIPIWIFVTGDDPGPVQKIIAIALIYIYIFVIGAIFGWIYGKIKKRKNYVQN